MEGAWSQRIQALTYENGSVNLHHLHLFRKDMLIGGYDTNF